jgi:hypothetical protein
MSQHSGFTHSADYRCIIFISGKKFWVWDLSSARSFTKGATYRQYTSHDAILPAKPPLMCDDVVLSMVAVPAVVADRVRAVGRALYYQALLSQHCSYSFTTLAAAVYRCRSYFNVKVLAMLKDVAALANDAKHCDFLRDDLTCTTSTGCDASALLHTGLRGGAGCDVGALLPVVDEDDDEDVCDAAPLAVSSISVLEPQFEYVDPYLENVLRGPLPGPLFSWSCEYCDERFPTYEQTALHEVCCGGVSSGG